jgi:hypothetical protein
MIVNLWNSFRRKYCPKRIYKLGTYGLKYFDDRTKLEKICDNVDWFIERHKIKKRYRDTSVFHSYFDPYLGKRVSSPEDWRKAERNGKYAYLSPRELDDMSKKAKKIKEEQLANRIQKKVENAAKQIKQGRSYIREHKERMAKRGIRVDY